MNCKECLPLIPSYLDEELSEAQAAPLRQHLMDCRLCRKALSGERSFKRWFESEPVVEVAVPDGFASRVARRAFAGDTGSPELDEVVAEVHATETPLLQFVLRATAIAAGILLIVSAVIFRTHIPDGTNMKAGGSTTLTKEELKQELLKLQDPAIDPDAPAAAPLRDMAEEGSEGEEPGPKGTGEGRGE